MIYYTDCFTLGDKNPSEIGGGYVITDSNGNILKVDKIYRKNFTNNEGELLGIVNCLKIAESGSEVYSDSRCAILWIKKGYSKSRKDLNEYIRLGKDLLEQKKCFLIWVNREFNSAGKIIENGVRYQKHRQQLHDYLKIPLVKYDFEK